MWPCAFWFLVLEEYNLETIDHIIHMSLLSHCPLLVAACLVYSGFTTILFGFLCPEFFAAFPSIFQHFPRFPSGFFLHPRGWYKNVCEMSRNKLKMPYGFSRGVLVRMRNLLCVAYYEVNGN